MITIVSEVMIFIMLIDIKLIVENINNQSIIEIIIILISSINKINKIIMKLLCIFNNFVLTFYQS